MKIFFFAQSRGAAGCSETQLEIEHPLRVDELWDRLEARYAGLAPWRKSARLARHDTYVAPGELLLPEDEVAVIPPVSGG